jgi:NAD(P)-dependent dehydrogenase (short-subunit alcohol dehydrogenase family)
MEAGRRFEGKTALVTGASRGIGLAVAARLAAEGARVVLTARKPEALEQAVAGLGGPQRAIGVAGHADDPEHQATAVARAIEAFGSLDVLVNNAGINPVYGPMIDLDRAALRKIFDVNVIAALDWVREAHRAWLGAHGGSVVNVASIAGLGPAGGLGAYGTSKAALIHLTAQLASELGPAVRVNAVAPAVVKTVFASALYEGREEKVAAAYPLGRLGAPEDVAGAVAYLASDDAAWVTGQTMVLDGGVTLGGGV